MPIFNNRNTLHIWKSTIPSLDSDTRKKTIGWILILFIYLFLLFIALLLHLGKIQARDYQTCDPAISLLGTFECWLCEIKLEQNKLLALTVLQFWSIKQMVFYKAFVVKKKKKRSRKNKQIQNFYLITTRHRAHYKTKNIHQFIAQMYRYNTLMLYRLPSTPV